MNPQHSISRFVPKPQNGKRWVIGDIHACPQTFRTLLTEHLKIQTQDQLFLLGDYIDRGPDSGAVIDEILRLQQAGFQVYPLMGNHEEMLLDTYDEYKDDEGKQKRFLQLLRLQKCYGVLDKNEQIRQHYLDFMRELPYFYELDDFFLVHASFNFKIKNPFQDTDTMVWGRKHEYNFDLMKGKRIIHGHTPTPLDSIQEALQQKNPVIPLDNGCVYAFRMSKLETSSSQNLGRLCALDLDSLELISLPNQEDPF